MFRGSELISTVDGDAGWTIPAVYINHAETVTGQVDGLASLERVEI
jgi:hypothetical protein